MVCVNGVIQTGFDVFLSIIHLTKYYFFFLLANPLN